METLNQTHTQTLQVTGMTCEGCEYKVQHLFSQLPGVVSATANRHVNQVVIETENQPDLQKFQEMLLPFPKYQVFTTETLVPVERPSFWNDTSVWLRSGKNTLNCLIGCSIGDFAMMTYLQTYQHHTVSMPVMMGLAMASGLVTSVLLETVLLKIRERFDWRQALKTAFSMSFLSMLAMELAENVTDLALTGGNAQPGQPFYWTALAVSLIAGWMVPLPYNYYKLKKHGKACH